MNSIRRRTSAFGLVFTLALIIAANGRCQTEMIERIKSMKAQNLSGRVQLGDSPEGVKGVLVEECTSDWKTVKASTYTDENGHFQLPSSSEKLLHYLRFSLRGAHTVLIRVKIDRSGPRELMLVLAFMT